MSRLRTLVIAAIASLAAVQVCLLALFSWGWLAHGDAYERVAEELGPLDPERFRRKAQTPHPLLDTSAVVSVILEPGDEAGILYDWIDAMPPGALDEFLTFSVTEPGTMTDHCSEARRLLDWAIETTTGGFGIEYTAYPVDYPPGYGELRTYSRLIFLCGWASLRDGDVNLAVEDTRRLGRLASLLYLEPALGNLIQATQVEAHQQRLLRELLATIDLAPSQVRNLKDSLPQTDLHEHFLGGQAIEAMSLEAELQHDLERLLASNDDGLVDAIQDVAFRTALDQKATGGYLTLLAYRDSYGLPFAEILDLLGTPGDEAEGLAKLRGGYELGDWRYVSRPMWVEHHRRAAHAMLDIADSATDLDSRCGAIRRALRDRLHLFQVAREDGGCRVWYRFGEDYLWPNSVRVFGNAVGDWWLPARPSRPEEIFPPLAPLAASA